MQVDHQLIWILNKAANDCDIYGGMCNMLNHNDQAEDPKPKYVKYCIYFLANKFVK